MKTKESFHLIPKSPFRWMNPTTIGSHTFKAVVHFPISVMPTFPNISNIIRIHTFPNIRYVSHGFPNPVIPVFSSTRYEFFLEPQYLHPGFSGPVGKLSIRALLVLLIFVLNKNGNF